MSTFAAPIRRGDFLFSSFLYVDVGNGNQHPRASVAELTNLLRPSGSASSRGKGRKREAEEDGIQAKDQVGHWYTAQLVHYGLATSKDKNTAKVRLLDALNQGKLEVPEWISKMEGELRKEWEKEGKKSRRGVKSTGGRKAVSGDMNGVVVGFQGVNNITVNVSVTSPFDQGHQSSSSAPLSVASSKKTASSRKRKASDLEEAVLQATPSKMPRSIKKEPHQAVSPMSVVPRKQPRIKQEGGLLQSSPPTPRKSSQGVKSEPQGFNAHSDIIILSGSYDITCPAATAQFPELNYQDLHLSLLRDRQRDVWWATFTWAAWHCIILMNPGPTNSINKPCTLGWRLKDLETGQLKFGRQCTGEMTCFESQSIQGKLENVPFVGTVEFWGTRVPGVMAVGMDGDGFQREWDGFVTEAYGR